MNTVWSINEQRPRERLFRLGPQELSDLELLTAIIGSGTAKDPAPAIAARLLQSANGSLHGIYCTHPRVLTGIKGIGDARCASILGGMELGRRMMLRSEEEGKTIKNPTDAWIFVRERMPIEKQETLVALHLDTRSQVLLCDDIGAKKRPNSCGIDIRKLIKNAMLVDSVGIILAHNHPSGDCTPSQQDIMLSLQVESVLTCLDIDLIDHLVIGKNSFSRVDWRSHRPKALFEPGA